MSVLTDNDLMFIGRFLHSFKCLGGDDIGLIDYAKIKFTLKHKLGLEAEEILQLIADEDCVKNGQLDYLSLCISILSTKAVFNRITSENGKVNNSKKINSRTFTRKKGNALTTNRNASEKSAELMVFNQCLKGSIFNLNSEEVLSNRYELEILENSIVEIVAKPLSVSDDCVPMTPIEILVLRNNGDKNKTLVTFSSTLNTEGDCVIKTNLTKGRYIIIPVLLNYKRLDSMDNATQLPPLINYDEQNQTTLTPICEEALRVVYDCIDLDGNGLLNQLEFDLFVQHISGVTAADEWSTVEDNFSTDNGQLNLQGFLDLYKMALETDPDDVTNMIQRMGLNNSLQLVNAQPFVLVVSSEKRLRLDPLPVASFSLIADKALRKTAVEQGSCNKVRNMNDLFLFTHRLPHRTTMMIQNQSHSKVTVRLDCTESENCMSHRGNLDFSAEIPPRSCMVGHHLFPADIHKPWNTKCIESLK